MSTPEMAAILGEMSLDDAVDALASMLPADAALLMASQGAETAARMLAAMGPEARVVSNVVVELLVLLLK